MTDEKKSLLHFVAHILEFAILVVLVALVAGMYIDRAKRQQQQSERLSEWYRQKEQYDEQSRLYQEWLINVRKKDEGIDSLFKKLEGPK